MSGDGETRCLPCGRLRDDGKHDTVIKDSTYEERKTDVVEELRQVAELAQQQPEDVQRRIAEVIALELEQREWDALVSTPESQRLLARLAAEARADIARGEVEEGGWDL